MLYSAFKNVYTKFKMHFYREAFGKEAAYGQDLTTVETFCMEAIIALDKPTVSEFASFMSLSSANAADKVNNLVKKGYLRKVQSEQDRRKYFLEVTPKYEEYFNISAVYLSVVIDRIEKEFSEEELKTLEKILTVIDEELMPEAKYK